MTRYDHPTASDGKGGRHPLAGVPQSALDAAEEALEAALLRSINHSGVEFDGEVDSVAHAVVAAALQNGLCP